MNRNNFWIHFGIAVILITMAAVIGQIGRWEKSLREGRTKSVPLQTAPKYNLPPTSIANTTDGNPEVLVKFKPGTTLAEIKKIVMGNNDKVEDEIEAVQNLVAIDDLDNADAETVAKQYAAMSDLVVYAEPNFKIELDKESVKRPDVYTVEGDYDLSQPNDPQFAEQWALNNEGQNGGKAEADISAIKAWAKTKGNDDVVVAVLDSGVDYTHLDLVSNMWHRPDSLPAYTDDELGTFNDENGFNATDNVADPMDDNGHGTHCAGVIGAEGG